MASNESSGKPMVIMNSLSWAALPWSIRKLTGFYWIWETPFPLFMNSFWLLAICQELSGTSLLMVAKIKCVMQPVIYFSDCFQRLSIGGACIHAICRYGSIFFWREPVWCTGDWHPQLPFFHWPNCVNFKFKTETSIIGRSSLHLLERIPVREVIQYGGCYHKEGPGHLHWPHSFNFSLPMPMLG